MGTYYNPNHLHDPKASVYGHGGIHFGEHRAEFSEDLNAVWIVHDRDGKVVFQHFSTQNYITVDSHGALDLTPDLSQAWEFKIALDSDDCTLDAESVLKLASANNG